MKINPPSTNNMGPKQLTIKWSYVLHKYEITSIDEIFIDSLFSESIMEVKITDAQSFSKNSDKELFLQCKMNIGPKKLEYSKNFNLGFIRYK